MFSLADSSPSPARRSTAPSAVVTKWNRLNRFPPRTSAALPTGWAANSESLLVRSWPAEFGSAACPAA